MEIEELWKFGKSMLPVEKGRWNLKRRDAGDLGELWRENRRVWGWMGMEVEGEWWGSLWLLFLLVVSFMEKKKKKHGREGFYFGRVECERWQLGRCCESGSKRDHLTMSLLRDLGL